MDDPQALVALFLQERVLRNASEHTVRNYGIDLRYLLCYLEKERLSLASVGRRTLRALIHCMEEEGAKRATLLRRLSTFRSFFTFLVREGRLSAHPMEEMEAPKLEKRLPGVLQYEQVLHLLDQPDLCSCLGLRDRAIMELFYSSGLRVSELAGLNSIDCDFQQRTLRVRGKGKKMRLVPITQMAVEWIKNYLAHPERLAVDPEALFLNQRGGRLTTRSIDRLFRRYLVASGLSARVTPHTIRHTIATHWLERGMDLKTIQTLLGHQSLATTTIYTQVSTRLKRQVYDKAHPLVRGEVGDGGEE